MTGECIQIENSADTGDGYASAVGGKFGKWYLWTNLIYICTQR